jgi:murein DD-endopeptidase MepM/ murein hydrolase activator NlpD
LSPRAGAARRGHRPGRAVLLAWLAGAACVHHRLPPAAPHEEPDLLGVVHVVRRGETLYRIARTYGVAQRALLEVNGLADPAALEAGAELFVPGAAVVLEIPPPDGAPEAAPEPARAAASLARPTPGAAAGALPHARGAPRVASLAPAPPAADARLRWPLQGVLYSRFGLRQGQRHDGIDLAAPEGTPVGAAAAGTVVYAGEQAGYGEIVILRHEGGLLTLYAHASALLVRAGETVAAGQPVARVGRSGRTSGPHLHFEVREGTRPRNPLLFLP